MKIKKWPILVSLGILREMNLDWLTANLIGVNSGRVFFIFILTSLLPLVHEKFAAQ
ncbi:MAG: hypothetical protein R2825_22605 [Saprospiraceae bacterium]